MTALLRQYIRWRVAATMRFLRQINKFWFVLAGGAVLIAVLIFWKDPGPNEIDVCSPQNVAATVDAANKLREADKQARIFLDAFYATHPESAPSGAQRVAQALRDQADDIEAANRVAMFLASCRSVTSSAAVKLP